MKEDDTFESILDLLKLIRPHELGSQEYSHVRWWWRGHADHSSELQPGVYRPDFPAKNEEDRLLVERHLAQDFRIEAARLYTGNKSDSELYFLQQHYRIRTRLLDWSNNALAALFFAVSHLS